MGKVSVSRVVVCLVVTCLFAGAPAARAADPADSGGGGPRSLFAGLSYAAGELLVPLYRVDRTRADGETTLIAIRNPSAASLTATAYFYDVFLGLRTSRKYDLGPHATRTVNLRDIPELTAGAGGIARGLVVIETTGAFGSSPDVSGDFFRVSPGDDFATGDRMIDLTATYLCDSWDFRFLQGGPFSGGTVLEILVDEAPGSGAAAPVAFTIELFDESGALLKTVDRKVAAHVVEIDVADLLGPSLAFGGAEIEFSSASGGGVVSGRYSADGRYSIGMPGSCMARRGRAPGAVSAGD